MEIIRRKTIIVYLHGMEKLANYLTAINRYLQEGIRKKNTAERINILPTAFQSINQLSNLKNA